MKSRKPILAIVTALGITLTACASVEEASINSAASPASSVSVTSPSASSKTSAGNTANHIKKQLAENLSVDANINGNAMVAEIFTAKYHSVDTNLLLKTLFSKKAIKKHDNAQGIDDYQATDGSYLNNSLGIFGFADKIKPNIHYAFFMDPHDVDDYNVNQFSTNSNFSFETRESAMDKIRKVLATLGVNADGEFTCYSLDHKTLHEQQDAYIKRQESDPNMAKYFKSDLKAGRIKLQQTWTENDDCYFLIFHPEINGIPLTRQIHGSADNGTEVDGTDITAIYDKNGIVDLKVNYLYDRTRVVTKGTALLGAEKALESIKNKFDAIILSTSTTVKKMSLEYVPVLENKSRKDFRLTPAWVCDIEQVSKKPDKKAGKEISHSDVSEILIDAVTGKEIS